jgi:hypothetical protein
MKSTPLVIKSTKNIAPGSLKVWNKYTAATSLIKSIDATAAADKDGKNDGNTSKIISGIPTPWARATIFKYAIEATDDGLAKGLKDFYDKIKLEWRALLALIALQRSNDIRVKKIILNGDMDNPSDFKARLGSMLFEEERLWKKPNTALAGNHPYIQLIQCKIDDRYVTVGATSPYSIVFTPPQLKSGKDTLTKFIKDDNWIDPIKCDLTQQELQKIYDTVTYIKEKLGKYAQDLNIGTSSLESALKEYQKGLLDYKNFGVSGKKIKRNNLFNREALFETPFDTLFNAEAKLYERDGRFYKLGQGDQLDFRVEEFLAESKTAVEITFKSGEGEAAIKNTAHLLQVKPKGNKGVPETRYFAVPLSEKGILYFQDKLEDLLDETTGGHTLKAEIKNSDSGKRLKVYLQIEFYTGGPNNETDITTVESVLELSSAANLLNERVVVWPNFISNNWNKYYLYSDLPHNLKNDEVRAFPLLGTIDSNNGIQLQSVNSHLKYIESSSPGSEDTNIKEVKIPVKHPDNASSTILKYEIYESELPFVGIELRVGRDESEKAGYLITKNISNTAKDGERKLEFRDIRQLNDGIVGIDFGSNNTCFSYYSTAQSKQKLITLHNRRRFFIGSERSEDGNEVANGMELFFFNKTETFGQLKSMLVAHNKIRLSDSVNSIKEVVRGGFAVMEKNLPISSGKMKNPEFHYDLEINRNPIDTIHNMKWSPDNDLNSYKYSYLKVLWLQINAELYLEEHKPRILRWAYPSAMSNSMKNLYEILWCEVVQKVKPISPQDGDKFEIESLTEGTAVATYAIQSPASEEDPGGRLAVGTGTMGIGYDVGGSTTDILILINKKGVTSPMLAKQSSILLAAQYLSKAIKKSTRIQGILKDFLRSENIKVFGIEKMNSDNAPYFLNAVFDRLTVDQLKSMYRYFYTKNEKGIFAIVAYVSGLISYYTGQLAARVIKEENIAIDYITKGIYGKGGNIFNWITTVMGDDGTKYYKDCFFAGLGKTIDLDKSIKDLEGKLEDSADDLNTLINKSNTLQEVYKYSPSEILLQKINDLKSKITTLEIEPESSKTKNIPVLKERAKVIEGKLVNLKKGIEMLDSENEDSSPQKSTVKEFEQELVNIKTILDAPDTSSDKDELEKLKRIRDVRINSNVKYQTNPKENKAEVSYGLSMDKQIEKVHNNAEIPEIIGEEGYKYDGKLLNFTDEITEKHLKSFGGQFEYPNEFKKLEEFTDIYCQFVATNRLLDVSIIKKAVKDLSKDYFHAYVESLPQFKTAQDNSEFDFKSPMIILEGMCLLDNVILKECLKD